MGILEVDADFQRVSAIGTVGEALDRLALDAVLDFAPAERAGDRANRGCECEAGGRAVLAERGAHSQRRLRPVAVRADVFFPGPDQLDRAIERFGDLDRLGQFVVDRAPAEPAAQEAIVDDDRLWIDSAGLGRALKRGIGVLRAHPHVDPVGPPMGGRVERLHWRMREIGNLVHRLDHLRRLGEGRGDVAMAAAVGERAVERGAIFGSELSAVGRSGWTEVPFDWHRGQRFLGAPEIVSDHRDAIGHRHGGDDPPAPRDGGKIIGLEFAAEHRTIGDGGVGHARQAGVDAESRRAGRLERSIDAPDPLADELELIGRLDRRLGGERDLGGPGRELSEGRRAPRGFMPHEAGARDASGGSTPHFAAAAAMSRARADAPACWRKTRERRTDEEPPVPICP